MTLAINGTPLQLAAFLQQQGGDGFFVPGTDTVLPTNFYFNEPFTHNNLIEPQPTLQQPIIDNSLYTHRHLIHPNDHARMPHRITPLFRPVDPTDKKIIQPNDLTRHLFLEKNRIDVLDESGRRLLGTESLGQAIGNLSYPAGTRTGDDLLAEGAFITRKFAAQVLEEFDQRALKAILADIQNKPDSPFTELSEEEREQELTTLSEDLFSTGFLFQDIPATTAEFLDRFETALVEELQKANDHWNEQGKKIELSLAEKRDLLDGVTYALTGRESSILNPKIKPVINFTFISDEYDKLIKDWASLTLIDGSTLAKDLPPIAGLGLSAHRLYAIQYVLQTASKKSINLQPLYPSKPSVESIAISTRVLFATIFSDEISRKIVLQLSDEQVLAILDLLQMFGINPWGFRVEMEQFEDYQMPQPLVEAITNFLQAGAGNDDSSDSNQQEF